MGHNKNHKYNKTQKFKMWQNLKWEWDKGQQIEILQLNNLKYDKTKKECDKTYKLIN